MADSTNSDSEENDAGAEDAQESEQNQYGGGEQDIDVEEQTERMEDDDGDDEA